MPDNIGPPSEFGGKVQQNRVQPPITPLGAPGHEPTASEKLMLLYTTGSDEDSTLVPDRGEAFAGLLPLETQEQLMRDAGALDKGVDQQ